MGKNPLNLTLRFILELAALVAAGYWGWTQHEGILRLILMIGVPLIMATFWGVFRVDYEPNKALVKVPGWVRLILEMVYFGVAAGLLAAANQPDTALVFGGVVLFHYLISYDRIAWLLKQ